MAVMKKLPVYKNASGGETTRRVDKATVYPTKGSAYTGYVIDGKTYKDPLGNQRIDTGSRVELQDGRSYVYNGKTGGVEDYTTAINSYLKRVENSSNSLREAVKKKNAGIDLNYKAIVERANQYKKNALNVRNESERAAKNAYVEASNPYGAIGQRTTALGLDESGYAESVQQKLGQEYQRARDSAASEYARTLAQIDAQMQDAYVKGENEKLDALAKAEQEILEYAKSAYDKVLSMGISATDKTYDAIAREEEFDYERAQAELEKQEKENKEKTDLALALLKLGVANDDIANALGISLGEAKTVVNSKKKSTTTTAKKTTKKEEENKLAPEENPEDAVNAYKYKVFARSSVNKIIERDNITDKKKIAQLYRELINTGVEFGEITEYYAKKIEQELQEQYGIDFSLLE